ncbi:hypothetical protein ACWGID_08600 [Kribbella sp. NPDC054772]
MNDGIITTPEPEKVLPTTIDTSQDATGVDVARNQAAYDPVAARLRVDPTGKVAASLKPELLERHASGGLHLKELARLTSNQREARQTWAVHAAGDSYLRDYTTSFGNYYTFAERVKNGPEAFRNYVNAPTRT